MASQRQPEWVHDRLGRLRASLAETHESALRLDRAIGELDPDQTADDLKAALRRRQRSRAGSDAQDLDRQVDVLRQRYGAINEMINRREVLHRNVLDTAADVELLAVQAVRNDLVDTQEQSPLEDHFAQLQDDLETLEAARKEVDRL